MRQIKFRGKNSKDEWVYGSLIINVAENDKGKFQVAFIVPGLPCASDGGDFHTARMERVNVDTIGQFTGLRDINGKDIYEGDIIRQDVCGDGSNGVVVYDEKHSMFALRYYDPHNPIIYGLYDCKEKELEILGNIHDNPGLLKQTTD